MTETAMDMSQFALPQKKEPVLASTPLPKENKKALAENFYRAGITEASEEDPQVAKAKDLIILPFKKIT